MCEENYANNRNEYVFEEQFEKKKSLNKLFHSIDGRYHLPQKSMSSLYIRNQMKYLSQINVHIFVCMHLRIDSKYRLMIHTSFRKRNDTVMISAWVESKVVNDSILNNWRLSIALIKFWMFHNLTNHPTVWCNA